MAVIFAPCPNSILGPACTRTSTRGDALNDLLLEWADDSTRCHLNGLIRCVLELVRLCSLGRGVDCIAKDREPIESPREHVTVGRQSERVILAESERDNGVGEVGHGRQIRLAVGCSAWKRERVS